MSETPITDMLERMLGAGLPVASALDTLRTMETLGLVVPVTAPSRDARSNDAIRAARYRANRKDKSGNSGVALAAETQQSERDASRDATVTTVTPTTDLSSLSLVAKEGIQEREGDRAVVVDGRSKSRRPKTRMTDDWLPDSAGHKFAAARGLRLVEIEIEITKFRNYWINRTDRDASKPRWDLAWQNWILNVKPAAKGNGHGPESTRDRQRRESAEALEQLRRFAENGVDDEGPGGAPREPNVGLLPFAKPA